MVTRELLAYVIQGLRKHTPQSALESLLLKQGWSLEDVKQVLRFSTERLQTIKRLQIGTICLSLIAIASFTAYFIVRGSGSIPVAVESLTRKLGLVSSPAFYVATNGNDGNAGTLEAPFATIQRARDAIRSLGQDGVTVYVRGGTYEAPEVIFGPSDAGSAGNPNVYRNYPGEYPVFVGGKEVTLTAGQTGIITLNLADYGIGSATVYGLSEAGTNKPLARTPNDVTPNYNTTDPWLGSFAKVASDVTTTGNKTVIKYENGSIVDPSTWVTPTNARAYIYTGENWWPNKVAVGSVDPGNRTITLASNTSYDMQYTASGYGQRSFFYMENLPEFLDTAGEWIQEGSTLKYFVTGTTTGTEKIRLATTTYLFNINNSSHLVIRNLSLHDTGRQSAVTPGAPVRITDSDNILIDGVEVQRTAGLGVEISGVSEYITVKNSRLIDTRHTAMRIDTDSNGVAFFKPLLSANVIFENNYISGVGFGGDLQNVGIYANAPGTIVRNNEINNVVRSGIQADMRQVNVTIENNKVSGLMRQARDGGGIYINTFSQPGLQRSWLGRGVRIIDNIVEDTGGYGWNADTSSYVFNTWSFGIYLDDWTSSGYIAKNVVRDSGGACLLIHSGRDNIFENNICYHASAGSAVTYLDEDPNSTTTGMGTYGETDPKWTEIQNLIALGYDRDAWFAAFPELADVPEVQEFGNIMENNKIRKNIIVKKAGSNEYTHRYRKLSTTNTYTDNIYFDEGAAAFQTRGSMSAGCAPGSEDWMCTATKTFAQWQADGYDAGSQIANPLFGNIATGDYSLPQNSPARALGFVPFNTSSVGLASVQANPGSLGVSKTNALPTESVTVSWTAPGWDEYVIFRHRITTGEGSELRAWEQTENTSYALNGNVLGEGAYKLCVAARNDLRIPSTGVQSDWGSEVCTPTITFALAPTPTPSPSSSITPTPTPAPSASSSTTPRPSATPKKTTTSPTPLISGGVSPAPSDTPATTLSPLASPSATVSASPAQRPVNSPTISPSEEPTAVPIAETASRNTAALSLSLLGLLSAAGAVTMATLWMASVRSLPI